MDAELTLLTFVTIVSTGSVNIFQLCIPHMWSRNKIKVAKTLFILFLLHMCGLHWAYYSVKTICVSL